MTQTLLERLTKGLSNRLHERIVERNEEERDKLRIQENVLSIVKERGYTDSFRSWGESDWKGGSIHYPIRYAYDLKTMTDPRQADGLKAVAISIEDTGIDRKIALLLLVDVASRTVYPLYERAYSTKATYEQDKDIYVRPLLVTTDRDTNGKHRATHAFVSFQTKKKKKTMHAVVGLPGREKEA